MICDHWFTAASEYGEAEVKGNGIEAGITLPDMESGSVGRMGSRSMVERVVFGPRISGLSREVSQDAMEGPMRGVRVEQIMSAILVSRVGGMVM